PNDEERDSSNGEGNGITSNGHSSSHPVNDEATMATPIDDTSILSEGIEYENSVSGSNIESRRNANKGNEPQGYNQREGVDYEETFSPVVKMVTLRRIISLVMHNSWPLYQLDVNNAFLYGDLNKGVHMDLPLGYYDESETERMHLPLQSHFTDALTVLRHLKLSHGFGIQLFNGNSLVSLYCDSTSTIEIAFNLVFHESTKHFEIDVHLVIEKVASDKQFCSKPNMVDTFTILSISFSLFEFPGHGSTPSVGRKSNAIFALPGHGSTSSVVRKSNAIFALPGHRSMSFVGGKSNAIFGRKLKIDMAAYGWKVRTSLQR
ncbi:ribonuclease H-like domain-containing protein, partial [Tanacetum coccineum]